MGKIACEWQETRYVLGYFGKRISDARKSYDEYVKQGESLGRMPELVGGGLVRSLGMSQPGMVYAVRRGERLATEKGLMLTG
ncbi:MAG: hypothetical protein B6I30_09980 [Desulfobacteraceae bacterium 4572_187]|nr:MAG: hypothetical protein B6I30_09980 [Desulfobacteraceae bacterium 4572_187]